MTQNEFNELMAAYLQNLSTNSPSAWSGNARQWAENRKIISGDSNGNKGYKKFATREEVALMLYKAQDYFKDLSLNEDANNYSATLAEASEQLKMLNKTLLGYQDYSSDEDVLNTLENVQIVIEALYNDISGETQKILTSMKNKLDYTIDLLESKKNNFSSNKDILDAINTLNNYAAALNQVLIGVDNK